ncbi:hypothetical protein [Methyloferula stellata]|uniref:hypothetical protein n=1 Tax=Methyloferula stellata TaxID=876270 RepID=UPI0012695E05|nr:hypothetical protein [Methyloferula stellata]
MRKRPPKPADREPSPRTKKRKTATATPSQNQVKSSLRDLARLPMDVDAYFNELQGESDRACALIAGAALSQILRDLLEARLILLSDVESNHLFDMQNSVLSSFADRSEMAYALGLIDKNERKNLDLIRGIRNAFAHTIANISFDTGEIATECGKLTIFNDRKFENPTNKQKFILSSIAQYINLISHSNKLLDIRLRGKDYIKDLSPFLDTSQ